MLAATERLGRGDPARRRGGNDCAHGFVDGLMTWADAHGVGYLGWTWNNWDCGSGPSLITDYTAAATAYGQGLKNRLASVSN
jgi:hypothetical protein